MELRSYVTEPERGARKWKGKGPNKRRCMRMDGGSPERAASVYKPGEGNGWSGILHISSILDGWTGCM